MNIKVGSWWNKLDDKQKAEMLRCLKIEIEKYGHYDVNEKRKFLTAALKKFGGNIERYNALNMTVIVNGKLYHYSHDRNEFNNYEG